MTDAEILHKLFVIQNEVRVISNQITANKNMLTRLMIFRNQIQHKQFKTQ